MCPVDKPMVIKSFDRAAIHYEENAILQQTVAGRLLERLDLIKINPGRIVDIGSGTGMTARVLGKKYKLAQVLQIDISGCMLRYSRQREKKFFSRQHHIQADMENIPLRDNSVDLVFSSLTYQWCNNLDKAYSEVCRLLSSNGPFIFTMLGPDTLKELRSCWASVDDDMHVNDFIDMHDVGDALGRAGFHDIVMDVEMITLEYADCIQLMRELKLVGAQNVNTYRQKNLTGKNKIQQVVSAYEQFRRNGALPATYEIVYGLAWKPAIDQARQYAGVSYVPVEKIRRRK